MIIPGEKEKLDEYIARVKDTNLRDLLNESEIMIHAEGAYYAALSAKNKVAGPAVAQQKPLLVDGNDVYLYGDIGYGYDEIGFDNVVDAIGQAGESDPVNIRINSLGGVVDEGFVIANYLDRLERPVNVSIDGMALSIASYIAMAGERRDIAENGKIMMHMPMQGVIGSADEFRRAADVLDMMADDIATAYTRRTQWSKEQTLENMRQTSWFNAGDSVKEGLATDLVETSMPVVASARTISPAQLRLLNRAGCVIKLPVQEYLSDLERRENDWKSYLR